MNKIYKVIWSKVKNQYVVVSELARSSGKQNKTIGKRLRVRLASLVICGAVAAFSVFGAPDIPSAHADGAVTSASQYIAIGGATTDQATGSTGWGNNITYYRDIDGHRYIYTQANDGGYYWVREGYTIDIVTNERFDGADEDTIINAYKVDSDADSEGLLATFQNVTSNTNIKTLNDKTLNETSTGIYGGAVNTATTAVGGNSEFMIDNGRGTYVNGRNSFQTATYDLKTGQYSYNGEVISTNNLYVLDGEVGVFVVNGEVYTGSVYGRNNEILMTAIGDDGKYYSYWGAEIVDPNQTIGSMTIGTLQEKFDVVNENIEKIHEDDIKEIQVGANQDGNGGTIGLLTNGAFDEDGNPMGGADIPGTITITSTGGTDGEDVAIEFSNTDTEGNTNSFTVAAGSKVEANAEGESTDTLKNVSINGKIYDLATGTTYTAGDGIAISDDDAKISVSVDENSSLGFTEDGKLTASDYRLVGSSEDGTGSYSPDDNGNITLQVKDGTTGDIQNVTLTDIASASNLTEVSNTVTNITKTVNAGWNAADSTGASVNVTPDNNTLTFNGDDGNISVTANPEDNSINVALSKDLNVTSVTANNMYVTNVDENKDQSVTNVEYVQNYVSNNDYYLRNGSTELGTTVSGETTGYKADENGNIDMIVANEDGEEKHVVLTDIASKDVQDQLASQMEGAVMYDEDEDGYDYSSVTLGGTTYNSADHSGGTSITNVAYADVNGDGSAAVNVDLLNDTVNDINTSVAKAKTEVKGSTNIDVQKSDEETEDGHTVYEVSLKDDVILGNEEGTHSVSISGTNGTVSVTNDKGTTTIDGGTVTTDTISALDGEFVAGVDEDGNNYIYASSNGAGLWVNSEGISLGKDSTYVTVDEEGTTFNNTEDGTSTIIDGGNITTDTITALDGDFAVGVDEDGNNYIYAGSNGSELKVNSDGVSLGKGDTYVTVSESGTTFTNTAADNNTFTTINGSQITAGDIELNAEEGQSTITGLTNTTWDGTTDDPSRAATEGQLQSVSDLVSAGWTATDDNGNKINVNPDNSTLNFSGDRNISVTADEEDGSIEVSLNDDIVLGNEEGTNVSISGTEGTVSVTNTNGTTTIDGGNIYAGSSVSVGDTTIMDMKGFGITSSSGNTVYYITEAGLNANYQTISNVAAGIAGTDAVNVSQLKDAVTEVTNADQHLNYDKDYSVDKESHIVDLEIIDNAGNVVGTTTIKDVASATDLGEISDLNEDIAYDSTGDGNVSLVDAVNNVNTKVDDLGDRVDNIEVTAGQHSSVTSTDSNIIVNPEGTNENGGTNYEIGLNNEKIELGDDKNSVVIEGTKGNITATGSISAGQTTISNAGVAVDGKTYITSSGIDANYQKITNVAAGVNDMDAVNVSQLKGVQQQVDNNSTAINNLGNRVSNLSNRIDKVGAGAAALAALHPLDFDPDDKLSFAAGYGNYAGENAVAVGAFYQPDEDTLFSIGGTFGNDENMVNAGVSFKLGRKNNVSRSRVSMAKELVSLRDEVAQLKALMAHSGVLPADGQLDTSALFPDIPENHWAYEYVHELARIGVVEGYPDGNFEGDRMMTRYELAAIIYRAMQKGVNVDRRMLSEFEPELKLIRVDVVAKDKNGNPTIERVRVNEDAQKA